MSDGNYRAANGARGAPVHKSSSDGSSVGDDFPMLCETCLGQNPYVRMVKVPFGTKICKISHSPYQAFRWKAGPNGRYKETIISIAVAKERNICQTCLNDMVYGLPVGVRDSLLSMSDQSQQVVVPRSEVGLRYFYDQQANQVEEGGEIGSSVSDVTMSTHIANIVPSRQLDRFSRAMQVVEARSKTAFRNLPKLCSFWLNGTCSRVLRKTCPFRPCCGTYVFPEIAGSNKQICASLIEQLKSDGPAAVQKNMDAETKDAIRQALKGNRDESIKKRVGGDDDLTTKYLNKMKSMHMELEPPSDESICTIWLGNVEADISEADIREHMYPYGHIVNVHVARAGKCAFVEYANREMAEHAASQVYKALLIRGRVISVNWAKPMKQAVADGEDTGEGMGDFVMPAPPGMEVAPISAYSLQATLHPPQGFAQSNGGLPPPPPPPGPPPPLNIPHDNSSKNETTSSNNEENSNDSSNIGADKQRVKRSFSDVAAPPPPPPPSGAPASLTVLPSFGTLMEQQSGSVPKAPKLVYASMNPARMGSKI